MNDSGWLSVCAPGHIAHGGHALGRVPNSLKLMHQRGTVLGETPGWLSGSFS